MTTDGRTPRIRYDEGCLAAHALNVVGDRWALLIVREMLLGPKRFQALRRGLPGITAAVMTQRLAQLAEAGVVAHDATLGIYALTESGRALLPVLQAMCRWGAAHPGHDPRRFISPTALMISMTAMIDSTAAQGRDVAAAFVMPREGFVQRLSGDGVLRPEVAPAPIGDFVLEGDGNRLAMAVYGPAPLADLSARGVIGLRGDADAAQRFVDLFRLRDGRDRDQPGRAESS
ncbi:MAG: winged helix-turn-helix transcriptional regulator [Paracoccus sp. (in: a-proteobacteria)]|jgi:DNA-binding HxlR family transcriptional regulator|uniref:winged helix-turn-helix transcriptional regulator n=1 Tax=unclassified Paracoccus (in: a-proteobacteria) TaxID=2688777 RepID=UPI000C578B4A|nr:MULTISPECIES: helix-turn-helix domain-containing protein [unclassified Paracoccus (in: a-proteobacteria)]MAN56464.1 transcriptional regulator [Paracoccus sp. (in: a-proteobacteria)]MBA50318.1 transcriptional regulator [Paracoccus sp. (in: a-proteobacteria)]HIC67300.1 transcriptional regulator [Paracoccus sp. (in: a-proteobacteria)]|tara:strand:- start:657 stop:1349 length:693 start_codon:yes stop_codon:yes gene_type:complete